MPVLDTKLDQETFVEQLTRARGSVPPARKLRLVAGTIGDLHRFAGPDMAIRPSGMH